MVKDSGRRAASRVNDKLRAFPVGSVGKAGLNVVGRQIREILQDLLRRHSGREILQHVVNSHSQYERTQRDDPGEDRVIADLGCEATEQRKLGRRSTAAVCDERSVRGAVRQERAKDQNCVMECQWL